jgi:hypothetical protein
MHLSLTLTRKEQGQEDPGATSESTTCPSNQAASSVTSAHFMSSVSEMVFLSSHLPNLSFYQNIEPGDLINILPSFKQ